MTILDEAISGALPSVFDLGRKLQDAVSITVGASKTRYDAWDNVSIKRSIESICGAFTITLVDKWRNEKEKWPLTPGQEIAISIGGENAIKGYIDRLDVSVSNEDRTISISGRDMTGDLVDSSAFSDPSTFKNITVDALAKKFATEIFGIKVNVEASVGLPFVEYTIKQGETVFEMLERAAKLRGLLLLSNEKGELVITNRAGGDIGAEDNIADAVPSVSNLVENATFSPPAIDKSAVSFIQGENIIEAQATYDHSNRFQTYLVKGQSAGSDIFNRKNVSAVSAVARDLAIKRSRTHIFIADGSIDKTAAQQRVNWEAIVRATKSLEAMVRVQGWQKEDKTLWKVNELARVDARFIGIDADLLITGVSFTKSKSGGTMTTLKLSRPDSYNPNNKELTEESDPSRELGWKKQGIAAAYDAIKDLF